MDSEKIRNEKDPFLREIFAMGYDRVEEDIVGNNLLLINSKDKITKKISRFDLIAYPFKIKRAILYSGEIHAYISEANGDAQKFRNLIEP